MNSNEQTLKAADIINDAKEKLLNIPDVKAFNLNAVVETSEVGQALVSECYKANGFVPEQGIADMIQKQVQFLCQPMDQVEYEKWIQEVTVEPEEVTNDSCGPCGSGNCSNCCNCKEDMTCVCEGNSCNK